MSEPDLVKNPVPAEGESEIITECTDTGDEKTFCPQCGAEVEPNAEDCEKCGAIFAESEKADLSDPKKKWYYAYKSRYKGPYTAAQMAALMRDTTISANTMVWKDGDKYARAAKESSFADIFLDPIEPPPAKLVKNNYFVAFSSLPAIFCAVVSAFLTRAAINYVILAVLYIALSTLFLRKDIKELNSKGIKLDSFVWLGIIFAPVYMLPRLEKTNKRYAYLLLWALLVAIFFYR